MATYTTATGETFEAESFFRCTSTLGMNLVRTEDGRVFDVEPGDNCAYEINDATLQEVEGNIVAWMDDPSIQSAEDFTGEVATDWDWVRTNV